MTAIMTLVSGPLYGALGPRAFWVMALLCAAALPIAFAMRGISINASASDWSRCASVVGRAGSTDLTRACAPVAVSHPRRDREGHGREEKTRPAQWFVVERTGDRLSRRRDAGSPRLLRPAAGDAFAAAAATAPPARPRRLPPSRHAA